MGQFEKNCPIRPEKHETDRPLRNQLVPARVAFVEAARFFGRASFFPAETKLNPWLRTAKFVIPSEVRNLSSV